MKIEFWSIGKTSFKYLEEGIDLYKNRLRHYVPFRFEIISDVKKGGKLSNEQLCIKEGELVFNRLKPNDYLIILDEKGKMYNSKEFAGFIDKQFNYSRARLIFLVGGAYGFSEAIYKRANMQLSLSKMTFSHQMIRLFFLEQLYRAMTILKNEPYHNE